MRNNRETALREALLAFAGTTIACMGLWLMRGIVGAYLQLGIAVVFIFTVSWLLDRLEADWSDYGLTIQPLDKGLLLTAVLALATFPPFLAGFVLYYDTLCDAELLSLCDRYRGWSGARVVMTSDFGEFALGQVFAVTLPEEFFYRGYLLGRLRQVWPTDRRILGVEVGPALLASSALFGVAHFAVSLDPRGLATFFPALVFGWMRLRTGSILAPTLFHALCNVYSDTLHQAFFR